MLIAIIGHRSCSSEHMQYASADTQQFRHCIWFLFLCYLNWTHSAFFGCMFQFSA